MVVKVRTLNEEKIVEAVKYAVSTKFNLDELSQLLVKEGGVDLDMLAKIIRENRHNPSPRRRRGCNTARLHPSGVATEATKIQLVWVAQGGLIQHFPEPVPSRPFSPARILRQA